VSRTPSWGWPRGSRAQEVSDPRLWFFTVRLLELAALFTAVSVAMQVWLVWGYTVQSFGPTGEPSAVGPPFLDRVVMLGTVGFAGVAAFGVLVGCVCLLAALVVLHAARPVAHEQILRWELAAVAGVLTLTTVSFLLPPVLGVVRGDPNAPAEGVVTYEPGPAFVVQQLAQFPAPLACSVLLAVVWLWWLRLREEENEDLEAVQDVQSVRTIQDDRDAQAPFARRGIRSRAAARDAEELEPIVVDDVEQIAPVDRLVPREPREDGATASGYDDYFRRP